MRDQKISPMAMMMFHVGQPYHAPGALYGLHNQIKFRPELATLFLPAVLSQPSPSQQIPPPRNCGGTFVGIERSANK
jgi:hypothetical protein